MPKKAKPKKKSEKVAGGDAGGAPAGVVLDLTPSFKADLSKAPADVQQATRVTLQKILIKGFTPGMRLRKYKGTNLWYFWVTGDWRVFCDKIDSPEARKTAYSLLALDDHDRAKWRR